MFRSHGGRGSAIANGELRIDVAFLGASASDELGNACGVPRSENAKSICGSLGYALPDARYAKHVVVITDDLVAYPNLPAGIRGADVESVVVVDSVGDSSKISAGAIRDSKNPRDILLAKQAAKVVINSGYFQDGFSIQTGTGGASLAVVKYIREEMLSRGIKASFALGGITAHMVKLHEEGLIGRLIDVQSFDKVAAESIAKDPSHVEVSAVEYASGQHLGSATHALDIVILGYGGRQCPEHHRVPASSRPHPLCGAQSHHAYNARKVRRRSGYRVRYCRQSGPAGNRAKTQGGRTATGRHPGPGGQGHFHHWHAGPAAVWRQSSRGGDEPRRLSAG